MHSGTLNDKACNYTNFCKCFSDTSLHICRMHWIRNSGVTCFVELCDVPKKERKLKLITVCSLSLKTCSTFSQIYHYFSTIVIFSRFSTISDVNWLILKIKFRIQKSKILIRDDNFGVYSGKVVNFLSFFSFGNCFCLEFALSLAHSGICKTRKHP